MRVLHLFGGPHSIVADLQALVQAGHPFQAVLHPLGQLLVPLSSLLPPLSFLAMLTLLHRKSGFRGRHSIGEQSLPLLAMLTVLHSKALLTGGHWLWIIPCS